MNVCLSVRCSLAENAQGRAGVLFVLIGFTLIVRTVHLLIPDTEESAQEREEQHHLEWTPVMWRRLFVPFIALCIAFLCVFVIEISFSSGFQANVYPLFIVLGLSKVIFRAVLEASLTEHLVVVPLMATYIGVLLITSIGTTPAVLISLSLTLLTSCSTVLCSIFRSRCLLASLLRSRAVYTCYCAVTTC